jgi:hypothetical protein
VAFSVAVRTAGFGQEAQVRVLPERNDAVFGFDVLLEVLILINLQRIMPLLEWMDSTLLFSRVALGSKNRKRQQGAGGVGTALIINYKIL